MSILEVNKICSRYVRVLKKYVCTVYNSDAFARHFLVQFVAWRENVGADIRVRSVHADDIKYHAGVFLKPTFPRKQRTCLLLQWRWRQSTSFQLLSVKNLSNHSSQVYADRFSYCLLHSMLMYESFYQQQKTLSNIFYPYIFGQWLSFVFTLFFHWIHCDGCLIHCYSFSLP